jgi:hypothetical protein
VLLPKQPKFNFVLSDSSATNVLTPACIRRTKGLLEIVLVNRVEIIIFLNCFDVLTLNFKVRLMIVKLLIGYKILYFLSPW